MKRILSLFLIIVLTLSMAPSIHADAAIKINKAKVTMNVGSKVTLKISGTKSKVTWKTNKKTVATVNSKGVVTAKGTGKAKITAKVGKKSFTCEVTVKDKYYGWVEYSTGNINNLVDGMLNGDIVYIDGKYYCSPEYFEMISNEEIVYENDVSDGTANNEHTLDPDTEFEIDDESKESGAEYNARLQERINEMLKSGAASSDSLKTDIAKAYKEFCKTWVSESELKNTYKISAVRNWPKNQIYLMQEFDNKLIIENVPDKFVNGDIYSGSGVQYQYLEKFVYEGESYIEKQFYFNREDLISAGVIK